MVHIKIKYIFKVPPVVKNQAFNVVFICVRVVVQAEERGVQSNGEDNLIFKTGRKTGTQVHTS